MKTVCAGSATVKGIDIYHGDYISDITKVMGAGFDFAYLKAWEYSEDSSFASRWAALENDKMIRGAYDFFHPGVNPMTQARAFLNVVGKLNPGDLPCALDWESTDNVPSATDLDNALIWLQAVEEGTGKIPVIYFSPYFIQCDARFARYPIWIAHYGVKCPLVPSPWTTWTFWQGSGSGSVPGMLGPCDTDLFNGTLAQLKTFTGL